MKKIDIVIGLSLFTALLLSGCATKTTEIRTSNEVKKSYIPKVSTNQDRVKKLKFKKVTYGKASWYGKKFDGKKTASGEIYNMNAKTAAHRTLPFNTMVRVTDMVSNRSEIVRINDRGPFSSKRIIDLSYGSAKKLGLVKRGVTDVKVEIVGLGGKVDRRSALPTSKKACVGDDCLVTVPKTERGSSRVKPFSILTKSKIKKEGTYTPVIESVDRDDVMVNAPDSSYSNNYSISVVDSDPYTSSNSVDRFPKIDTYAQKVSVQVGAFRKHSGAEMYVRRYSLLSKQYKAVIKNGLKDSKTIYRVQIEGFGSELEARKFISKHRHSLSGAFLVRR
ncbi:septal ring lytic transglycosylase RlpA family protein [Sulfurovum sp. bin170]|uniref:septal ring lytic transglycosylase RlpA family protein n=1 Tax=Sulfurovum sp. bin170 TaxID=2695268 RepID=UPI0021047103|nr:septal ring lytic transglycosylase RlpA family protein [Sulfurovum sp. bin170]